MRLWKHRRGKDVVYTDQPGDSPIRLLLTAAGKFGCATLLLSFFFVLLGSVVLSLFNPRPASTFPVFPLAIGGAVIVAALSAFLGPTHFELEPSARQRSLIYRHFYLGRSPRERVFQPPQVEAVVLRPRDRGGPYLQLHLVLADGTTHLVQEGKELDRMDELAQDVAAALGLRLGRITSPNGWGLNDCCLTRVPVAGKDGRWVDFDYRQRLLLTWCLLLGCLAGAAYLAAAAVHVLLGPRPARPPETGPLVFGVLIFLVFGLSAVVFGTASAVRLTRARYRALRLSRATGCVTLQTSGLDRGRREETLAPGDAAAVVVVCNRKRVAQEVWLEGPPGRRRHIDSGKQADELRRLAEDLSRCLKAPLREETRACSLP